MAMKLGDIPVVTIGPGSQPAEQDGARLEYISMPTDMATYSAPSTPELLLTLAKAPVPSP